MRGLGRTRRAALAALVMGAFAPFAGAQPALPKIEDIRALERQMQMPSGAYALGDYDRYYALSTVGERRVIMGLYLHRTPFMSLLRPPAAQPAGDIANAYLLDEGTLPMVMDGGCSVVTVYYDIATARLIPFESPSKAPQLGQCNGFA